MMLTQYGYKACSYQVLSIVVGASMLYTGGRHYQLSARPRKGSVGWSDSLAGSWVTLVKRMHTGRSANKSSCSLHVQMVSGRGETGVEHDKINRVSTGTTPRHPPFLGDTKKIKSFFVAQTTKYLWWQYFIFKTRSVDLYSEIVRKTPGNYFGQEHARRASMRYVTRYQSVAKYEVVSKMVYIYIYMPVPKKLLCVLCIEPFFLPVDIQHTQCPCQFFTILGG